MLKKKKEKSPEHHNKTEVYQLYNIMDKFQPHAITHI